MSDLSPQEIQYQEQHASQSLQPNILAAIIIGFFFACLSVILRFYARKRTRAGVRWDDWLILATLFPLFGFFLGNILLVASGFGKHVIFQNPKDLPRYQKSFIASMAMYAATTVLSKASVLCFYWRLFQAKPLYWLCWSLGVFVFLYNLALLLVNLLQCRPLSVLWTSAVGECTNMMIPLVVLGAINAAVDVVLLAIPLWFIGNLKMKLSRKLQLVCVFSLGGCTCIFGIIRVTAHFQMRHDDLTYTTTPAGMWSFCETSIGVVCICLPTLAGLVNKTSFVESTKAKRRSRQSISKEMVGVYDRKGSTETAESGVRLNNEKSRFGSDNCQYHARVWTDGFEGIFKKKDSTHTLETSSASTHTDVESEAADAQNQGRIMVQYEVRQTVEDSSSGTTS